MNPLWKHKATGVESHCQAPLLEELAIGCVAFQPWGLVYWAPPFSPALQGLGSQNITVSLHLLGIALC